jgi:putative tryptophan/tyrosine transport system substrate-binding protein
MKRREFITLLGGTAAAWPLAAQAQPQGRVRRVSILMGYVDGDIEAQKWTKAFSESLNELGWKIGRNIELEYRWAGPYPDRLRGNAEELVRISPDVLVAGSTPALKALQTATRSIPIVFVNVADPVGQGLIASFARPGGNTTGFGAFDFSMAAKWVQAIKEIAPSVTRIGVIFNPETGPYYVSYLPFVETASRLVSVEPIPTAIHDADSITQNLVKLAEVPNTGVVVFPSALFTTSREIIIKTVAQLRLPTVYPYGFFVQSGGLLSYGFDVRDMYQRAASYVDRILQGTKVSDLPAQFPTKIELALNLKTARALGLTVPPELLSRADEVIE